MEGKAEASSGSKSFDSILLVDLSGSMETEDVDSEGKENLVREMEGELDNELCEDFFSRIRKKEYLKRYEAAELCVLRYILERMNREDLISIITFSDHAESMKFDGKNLISPRSEDLNSISEDVITGIETHVRGRADIAGALEKSIDVMKGMDKDKIKSIILLTDVIDENNDIIEIVKRRLSPREDVVVNIVCLGDVPGKGISKYMADRTGGDERRAKDLKKLVEIISSYSRTVSVDCPCMLK